MFGLTYLRSYKNSSIFIFLCVRYSASLRTEIHLSYCWRRLLAWSSVVPWYSRLQVFLHHLLNIATVEVLGANHILSRYQIWFPPNMVPAKVALYVELHIVPRGTIQTEHGTREPHGPSVISGKTTNQLLSLMTQGVSQGLR